MTKPLPQRAVEAVLGSHAPARLTKIERRELATIKDQSLRKAIGELLASSRGNQENFQELEQWFPLQAADAASSFIVIDEEGEPGQVATLDEDGKPIWADAEGGGGGGFVPAPTGTYEVHRIVWKKEAGTALSVYIPNKFTPNYGAVYATQNGSFAAPLSTAATANYIRGMPLSTVFSFIEGGEKRPVMQMGVMATRSVLPVMPGEVFCKFTRTSTANEAGDTILWVVLWVFDNPFGSGVSGGSGVGGVTESKGTLSGGTGSFKFGMGHQFWEAFYSRASSSLPVGSSWTQLFSESVEISKGVFGTCGVQVTVPTRKQEEEKSALPTAEWFFPNTVENTNAQRLVFIEGG